MSKQTAESAVCLACGRARAAPKKEIFRDNLGRPKTFCNSVCFSTYVRKPAKA